MVCRKLGFDMEGLIMDFNIELVIFDMDGLMFDTEKVSYESWVRATKKYGYMITKELFNLTLGTNREKTKEIFISYFGEDIPIEEMLDERVRISDEIVEEKGVPIKKGLYDILDYLKNNKYKIALATSANRKRTTNFLTKAKVIDCFDCIVCGDEVKNSKPNPEIFLKVLDYIPCKPENILVLEDSEAGIEAAYSAGMIPIMIPDIIQPSSKTKEKVYKVFTDLTQVISILR